ncbi:recombinase family protein [Cryptosporangium aurantiacum]|uniref:Resolvase, N terminal domain n=1 Tax=Cryptosporangium aurantiacum TaxID=134849 RepID=A0A1M7RDY8_9ACTN|nr:recombinase family protein [Cryptosporangium aurantiacum]SHN44485.1 Resolvase, N terminal domain [Cryptosporangium aurantiacum]
MATTVVGYLRPPRAGAVDSHAELEALRRYAEDRALELRHVYADAIGPGAITGRRGERSGFAAALADVRERRADGVLLLDVAHLSWHPDIRDSLAYLVEDAGGRLFVADEALASAQSRT